MLKTEILFKNILRVSAWLYVCVSCVPPEARRGPQISCNWSDRGSSAETSGDLNHYVIFPDACRNYFYILTWQWEGESNVLLEAVAGRKMQDKDQEGVDYPSASQARLGFQV